MVECNIGNIVTRVRFPLLAPIICKYNLVVKCNIANVAMKVRFPLLAPIMKNKIKFLEKYGNFKIEEKDLEWIIRRIEKLKEVFKYLK